jgi:hypothetical protein
MDRAPFSGGSQCFEETPLFARYRRAIEKIDTPARCTSGIVAVRTASQYFSTLSTTKAAL